MSHNRGNHVKHGGHSKPQQSSVVKRKKDSKKIPNYGSQRGGIRL